MTRHSDIWGAVAVPALHAFYGSVVTWYRDGQSVAVTARVARDRSSMPQPHTAESFAGTGRLAVAVGDVPGLADDPNAGLGEVIEIPATEGSSVLETWVVVAREDRGGEVHCEIERSDDVQQIAHNVIR